MMDRDKNDPKNEQTEEASLPESHYKVVEPEANSPYDQFAEANRLLLSDVRAVAEEQPRQAQAPAPRAPREAWAEQIRRYKKSPFIVYGAAGLGLGVLLLILFAVVSSLMAPPSGRYDMGPVTSAGTGLNGRLFLQWDKKLQYRMTLEPTYPDQQTEFAVAVSYSQQPLSVQINLLDLKGFVLCSKEILVKYNAQNEQLTQDQLDTREAARERGRDVFEIQTGPDGRTTAINAHGDMPCTAKAYEKALSWSFATNFPSVAEQDELLKSEKQPQTKAGHSSAEENAGNKKTAAKPAAKLAPFSIEGDDAIVDLDAFHGTIVTRGRKTFFVDKTSPALTNTRWQDYPVVIHYRCDRTSECTLMNGGAGVMHARLAR